MPKFEIEQYEIHTQRYRVEADSEAEAVKRLFDGEAIAVDDGLEYIEVAEDVGLPVEEYRELADELRKLGESIGGCNRASALRFMIGGA